MPLPMADDASPARLHRGADCEQALMPAIDNECQPLMRDAEQPRCSSDASFRNFQGATNQIAFELKNQIFQGAVSPGLGARRHSSRRCMLVTVADGNPCLK